MSSTSQPTTFADLYTDLMNRARESTGNSATVTQAKRYINTALQDMHIGQGEKFPWAERRATLTTKAKYTTGTLAVTQYDKLLTGTDTAWLTDAGFGTSNVHSGGKMVISGSDEIYEIEEVNDTLEFAWLKEPFLGSTETAATYVYYEDEVPLPADFLRPIDQQSFDDNCTIELVGRTEFRRHFPKNTVPGRPRVGTIIDVGAQMAGTGTITAFSSGGAALTAVTSLQHGLYDGDSVTISGTTSYNGTYYATYVDVSHFKIESRFVSDDATGTFMRPPLQRRKIRLAPPPSTQEQIRFSYVTANLVACSTGSGLSIGEAQSFVDDSDEPIVPLQYRHAIVYHALANWYRDKKDDTRSADAANEYTKLMLRVISDNEIGSARPRFVPRVGSYRRRAKRPWSGGSRRYDTGGRFDRME